MSADRANLALIQDEDVLRKMWADTEDFSKKKEIRSHMYKLREKRLKEFYNSGEIIESKTTKTSNKVSQSSTHADSLIDQSFNSLKSKEVRDSESPTRDIHYKAPDNNEWQISTNKEISKDGKTKVSQTVAAVQGSQKIEGGQLDFKARNEQTSSVYEDGNTKATTNKFQASESSSSHVVKNIPAQPIEYPSNLEEGTKVSRESKTLPDGSVVTTTRYDTKGGASQTCVQSGHVTTSQTSSSSRSVNQSKSSSEFKQTGNKVIRASNDLPEDTVAAVTRYDTQTGSSNITRQSNQLLQAQTSSNRQFSDKQSSYTTSDVPSNLQGVTKVTRETKTLPDGSTVTTTRYDTTGATSHSEVRSNVKVSKDHDFATSRSTRHSEQASVKEYGTLVDNQKHIDQNVIQDRSTENRSTVISSDERKTHNVDQSTSKVTKEHYTNENIVNRVCLDETDGNKISHVVHTSMKQPTEVTVKNVTTQKDHVTEKVHVDNVDINEKSSTTVLEISEFPSQNIPHAKESPNTRTIGDVNKVTHIVTSSVKQPTETVINITNVTTQKENATDNFVNIERQQEQITRDQKVEDTIIRPTSTRPRGRSPVKTPRSEYEPSKSTEGQYDTTYRADYTTKKISVELSPVHDAFARSLRNTSPDRTPSRGSHRTSNSSLPEKMRHPSRYSPERYQKDRSVSPTKSDHKGQSMKRTASNETITISTAAKFDVTRKKETTRKSNTDVITKSRSPSPSKIRSGDIITDLDNDVCITTTTIREKSTTGARPTSLELTKKSRKITDRSPSSPLSDAISPKRSPTKEVRRSSSFRSPTKDSPSPHGKFDGPRRSSLKSPKKETSPSKTLPEDRPLKRTDTYEERCRQILGITEVSDKRKSSLERSSSKRNSFRRNLSSTNVDATSEKIKSPTKEPLKSPTKESDKRRPSSRPTSKDFTADVTLETIVTQKTVTGDKPTKKSSISEFPSQRRSPTRDSQITVEIPSKSAPSDSKPSSKRPQISEFPSQRRFPSKETLNKKMDKTVSLEDIVTQEKVTEEYKSTKRPEITEFPSQKRSPSKESLKTQTDKTISVEDIFTTETVTHSDDVTDSKRVEISKKGPSISEFPSQIRHPKDKPQQTSKFITNEKINRNELVSSTEDVTSECDLITVTTSTKSISKDEKPSKKPTTESKLPKKDIPRSDEQPKKKGPSIKEFPSQIRSPSNKINTNKFITQEKLATDEITTSREDITKSTTNFSQDTVDTEDITDIIEDIIITDDISKSTIKKPTKKSPSITEFPSQTRPTQKDTTDFVREVTVTDEFDINISKSKPSDEKPKEKRPISEFPSQIRKVTEQKEIVTRNISPGKIAPKEKPKISEFPSQIRREKIPVLKEPQITAKHVEPISYEGRIPVEEPLCVKRRINTDCPGDDHKHVKKIIPSNTKKLQKQYSVDKPEKKSETPINKKPMNGLTEYKSQYTSPKFAPKTKPSKPEETDKVFKPSNKINTFPTKSIKPLVNGVCSKQDKIKEISKVYLTSTKPEKPVSETIIKKTSKSTLLKENESPEKPKKLPTEKVTRITPVRGATPTTKLKSSHPEVVKKHLVTTTITLNNGHQTKSPKPKEIPRRSTNYPKKTTGSKQQKNELSTETDEESFVEEMTENVEVTRKNVAKVNKKLDKKCITTKTVIINNNDTQAREIVVDLQRSTSSREPTPDRVCPVPLGAENGEIEFARYPDEIVEPEEDNIKRKPKRLSDIPLIEYEDTTNFSRITEIVDSHVITERDKVDHTDESLLSVNRKINLFSDTAEKLTKDNKKSSGPAPKVDRPKLPVTKGLESDECLLSVSEKVNKFVNTAEQFMNVHEAPERPKSPRCKFNDDKVNSKTFITKEKKTVEEQNTRKISLENLNVDTKKSTDRKPNRTASPEYPNYGTITKKVSLENLDSKSCTKPQEYIRTKSPDRKSPTRSDFTSKRESTTKEVSSVDKKFQSREQSPEPKQITPNRRPSNEYASIKTQEKSTRKNISPEPTDATPKSGKTKTVEDKRTILSSTGRLRSTESIKKARELFENISKKQETVRPSSRSPNLNRNVTTKESVVKKLVYSSEDNKSGRSRSTSPEKGDNPHYMLPLDRRPQSPERENTDTSSVHNIHYVHTEKGDIPHYMLPLDRRPQSPQREGSATSSVHDLHVVRSEKGDIPHYMSPLDRRPHSPERETSATTSVHHSRNVVSGKGDIPHYMSPLDRPHSSERENTDTSSVHNIQYVHTEKGDIPHYMLPLDRRPQSPQREGSTTSSVHDLHVVRSEKGEVPHYMSPLDRRPHSPERETSATTSVHHSRNATSGKGDIPHYMLPLDRRPQSPQREGSTTSSVHDLHVVRSEKGEVPHYMSPLDRRPHSPERETPVTTSVHQSRHVISGKGDIPHYMLPLDRRPESPQREGSTTSSVHDLHVVRSEKGDTPHYMSPLDRRPHSPERETPTTSVHHSRNVISGKGDIPHYMSPLERRPQSPERENTDTTSDHNMHYVPTEKGEIPHYMLPLDRSQSPERENTDSSSIHNMHHVHTDKGDIPHYMLPLDRRPQSPQREGSTTSSAHDLHVVRSEKGDIPHYMSPLDRRPHSPERDSKTTKFGVTLRKTPTSSSPNTSHPASTTPKTSIERRFGNIETLTEEDIQDIFEIEILEELIQIITSYEIRRIIRIQIRLVKKLILENRLTTYIQERKQLKTNKKHSETATKKSEFHSNYSYNEKRQSSDSTAKEIRKQSPVRQKSPSRKLSEDERITTTTSVDRTSVTETRKQSPTRISSPIRKLHPDETITRSTYTVRKSSVDKTPEVVTKKTEEIRKSSPERITKTKTEQIRKTSTTKTTYTTEKTTSSKEKSPTRKLEPRKTSPERKPDSRSTYSVLKKTEVNKKKVDDNKPEWVTQRNLKKVATSSASDKSKTTSSKTVAKQEKIVSTSNRQPTDLITSSYGVGPTDENGTPLFGLKALRTQNNNSTTKVQGTVIKSEYYSENGQEPVGQISVTKYSTDPRDLSTNEQIENNNFVTSVTTTQQFGYEDTPSLDALTSEKIKTQVEDSVDSSDRSATFKRQNSVKAISQKFIDSTVDSLKNERQTSYPKAGLILRTSSFKDSKSAASNEEDTSAGTITSTKTTKRTTATKTTSGGGTFLSNKSTISGVQDVISRMKTEEYQEGESSEDAEARNLLNKFLGSQVLLSGMENRGSSTSTTKTSKTTEVVPTSGASTRKTIKITKTITEGGKTKTKNLVFQSPITEEELDSIWDEQTLRLLLDQTTEYEERRFIRNRLKIIMAEQEACAELVEQASEEQSTGKIEETVNIEKSTTESPVTTTTQVTKVTTQQQITKKPLSPFAKFRQLDKQNSLNTPPSTPGSPKTPGNGPLFKFTDPAVSLSASTIKERLLFWCRMKTKEYENVQLDNFSSSWADGLAFCALIHHFLPDAFDYHTLTPKDRRHNFELAFRVASEKADIFPLLDVEDMMALRKPDWKCVFTYVQSIHRRFKNEEI